MTRVRVLLDVPETLVNISKWSIGSLLYPLGVEPEWYRDGDVADADIYYGANAFAGRAPVALALAEHAEEVYTGRRAIESKAVRWTEWAGDRWPLFFVNGEGKADLVASTWFLLSGWQEIVTRGRDEKGRFRYADSWQAKLSISTIPPVDAYREWLCAELEDAGLRVRMRRWNSESWAMCPTVDVDYLRKWRKGMIYRELVEHLILGRRGDSSRARVQRAGRVLADALRPGDVYRQSLERICNRIAAEGASGTIFFKAGAHGPHDVHYNLDSRYCSDFISSAVRRGFEIGLHPSYHANTHGGYLAEEASRLSAVVDAPIRSVRQHYLRYELPATLRLHEEQGFQIDSTLGFAEQEGFRRGTCVPFRLFDVHRDRSTTVWEMPLTVMDGTLFNRRGLSPDDALEQTKRLFETCRRFRGCAVMLWHNVLWDELDAPGWARHFTGSLESAAAMGAKIDGLSSALERWRQSV